jgi:Uma2 family endonuclease
MSAEPQKYFFNVDEYYRMAGAGLFSEGPHVELIEGEVIEMSPIGSRHAGCVDDLTSLLVPKVARLAIVRVQGPIRIDEYSEPQPDIALLKPRRDSYRRSHPTPSEVLLVIEVADTSAHYDRNVKLPLYARAGIPEAWLVILPKDIIEVHTEPKNGKYTKVQRLRRGKTLASSTVAGLSLKVDDILG